MPSLVLTDLGRVRLNSLSLFLFLFAMATLLVWVCWKVLRREFGRLPELSFGGAFALVSLWGLVFLLALTMISGARELLTPGAWEKRGLTYQLRESDPNDQELGTLESGIDVEPSNPIEIEPHEGRLAQRREKLNVVGQLLSQHATNNGKQFPSDWREFVNGLTWKRERCVCPVGASCQLAR